MATTTTRPGSSHRPLRPLLFVVAALAVAGATYGADRVGLLHGSTTLQVGTSTSSIAPPAATLPDGIGVQGGGGVAPVTPDAPTGPIGASGVATTQDLDRAIGVWTANLQRDPADFISAQNLGVVYYTRGRLTGSADDYARAREAVDAGLAAYPDDRAAQTLKALLLYTLHDFDGSLRAAQAIVGADPDQLQALATVGDSQLELGRYDAAAATFATLDKAQPGAAVTARLARLASLRGHDADATTLARRARQEAVAEGSEGTSLAFYDYLIGYLAFQAGQLDAAAAGHQAALQDWPGSYLALEGLAKVRAAQDRVPEAIELYRRAIAIVPQPEFLSGLGDLYAIQGDAADAARQYATVRAIARLQALQAQLFNRQLVLFQVNHDEDVAAALAMADRELEVRRDVYAWDADAWALLANGRAADADVAMRNALALGGHDPLLAYHAGMIAHALGDDVRARMYLTAALETNPGFDPLQAAHARSTLAGLSTP